MPRNTHRAGGHAHRSGNLHRRALGVKREQQDHAFALPQCAEARPDAVGIERASAFLMTRQSGEGLGRVYLSGGGSRIPGMVAALGHRMSVETHVVNPFERVPVRPDAASAINLDEVLPMLLLSLGLALRSA